MSTLSINISNTLKYLLARKNLSEAELGRRTAIPQATVNRLILGKTPNPRASTLQVLANYFGITLDQLLGDEPIMQSTNAIHKKENQVPVISWDAASSWQRTLQKITHSTWFEWISAHAPVSANAYALEAKSLAMSSRFTEGSILIVDPDCIANNKDFVIAEIDQKQEPILRQFIIEANKPYLKALDTNFEIIQLQENHRLLGVVIESRLQIKHFL